MGQSEAFYFILFIDDAIIVIQLKEGGRYLHSLKCTLCHMPFYHVCQMENFKYVIHSYIVSSIIL